MSAPADSTMSGGNAAVVEGSRLQQPSDAVPMESIGQEPAPSGKPGDDAVPAEKDDAANKNAVEASSSDAAVVKSDDAGDAPPVSPKSKEKQPAATPSPPPKERQESVMAIGPAQDEIYASTPGAPDVGPVCNITLLLTSGSRHPYKIDGKYLSRRNVTIPEETESGHPDPFSISIYTLKELILREWRSDWEAKPASPSSIRLIHFGKLLDDKEQLKKYQFSTESPNVVHMSIRPQDLDEEEPKGGSKNQGSGGADGVRARTSGCCVIL